MDADATPTALTGHRRSAFWRAVRLLFASVLLTTCSTDSSLSPGNTVKSQMDLSALFRAGGTIPIPVDTVVVELRHASDSSVAFQKAYPASQFRERNDSLIIEVTFDLQRASEEFYLYVEARGAGVLYYTVRSLVRVTAGQQTQTPPLTPTYVGPGSNATSVQLGLSAGSVAVGDSVLATAQVFAGGQLVAGVPVGIETSDSAVVLPRAAGIDRAWLVAQAGGGPVTVTARTPTGLTATGPLQIISPAAALVLVSGNNQQIPVSTSSQPLVVRVDDAQGNPFPGGVSVTFALVNPPAGTTLGTTTVTTDLQGLASTVVNAGATGGATQVTATAAGLAGSPVTFDLTVQGVVGTPGSISANSPVTQGGVVNQLAASPPSVLVRDQNAAPLAGVTVTFAVTGGGGSLTGASQVTNASGVATVTSWRFGQSVTGNSVSATVAGLTPVVFNATPVATSPAAVVIVSGDNQTGPAGAALAAPLVVEVRDTFANPVSGVTVAWSTPDGGSLAPTSSTSGSNGQTQSAWTLGPTAPSQTATATVASVTPASFTATATFGPPAITLAFVGLPDVGVGKSATVRASIPTPAPAGGVAVTLTSDQPSVAQVAAPGTQTIAVGTTSVDFTVTGVALGSTTLRGNAAGFVEGTLPITVQDRSISVPATLNVPFGGTQSLPIVIGSPAPAGGVVVSVVSSDPTVVGVATPSVTIAAGAVSTNATVQGVLPGTANVTVDNPAYTSDVSVVTTSANLNVLQTSTSLNSSFPITIDIRLESSGTGIAAPAGGVPVTLTSRDPACVVPASPVTIPAGLVTTTAVLSAGTGPLPCSAWVVATAPNIAADSVLANVNPTPGISLTANLTVGAGLQQSQSGNLGASNHGGVTVRVTSSDPSLLLVAPNTSTPGAAFADIVVPAGNGFFNYTVQALEGQSGAATVTASAPGFTDGTGVVDVVTPAVDIIFLGTSTTSFSPNSGFQLRSGIPNGQLTAMQVEQAARAGGPGINVTVTNDSAAVAQLVTQAVTGQSVAVPIAAGQARSAGSVATGGVEFDPLSPGFTSVKASAPGFVLLPQDSVGVTVTAPAISFGFSTPIGSGLQVGGSANLGASNHGGVTVRVTSRDPAVLLVAPNASTAGSAFIDIPVLNGNTSVSFTLQALEGQTGAIDVVVSAPGFVGATATVNVVPPALDVIFLPTTTTSLSPNSGFQIRVGVPNGQLTAMSIEEALRAGGPGANVAVSNSDQAVAQLVTLPDTSQLVSVTMAPQQSRSPGSVATGGVEFDPIAPGTTDVAATIPGFIALPTATQTVTVTGAGISVSAPPAVGAGLQAGGSVSLGASNHGGVTVRISSSDPSVALIAPNASTAGTPFIDVPVANGNTFASYVLQGVEGQTGTVTVSASAPGFSSGTSGTADIVQPALDVIFLSTSQTTFSPNNAFQIRIGIPNANNTGMAVEQAIRAGGTAVTATVLSSTPAVGALVTQAGSSGTGQVSIAPQTARSPGTVASGGIEFDPILGGTTTVSATIPGYAVLPTASVVVNVTSPGISLSGTTTGSGLQVGLSGSLGASNHGGVTVRVSSSQPAIALVSPNSSTPGTPFIDIPVANGNSGFSFVVQGVEGQTGSPALTATATGFTDGNSVVTVVQPAVDLIFVQNNITTLSPNNVFQARIGIPNAGNTAMQAEQGLRAGGNPATVTVGNSNPAVGTLLFQAGPAQSGSVSIALLSARTPSGASNGGVEFVPQAAGTTTLSASIPGFVTLPTASQGVTVTVPGISLNQVTVGSGLQVGTSGNLGASNHGGVTVRVTSANPSLFLVAPNATSAGAPFIDIAVANGSTNFSYVVQGLEGVTGTANITAAAPGFTTAQSLQTVVQPAADILFLSSSLSATAGNDAFQIRTGTPDALGNSLSAEQAVRFGATDLTATVSNSAPAVAQLTTSLGSGQSGDVQIVAGQARSPATVATGGIEFDPLAQGSTTVSVTIPGFRIIPASSQIVTVTP